MNTLPAIHFCETYLLNPANPVTVNLIGAGGTGSAMLTALARMNHTFLALGHPGLHVKVWDDDRVESPNLGRQFFAEAELSGYKSVVLVNRNNRFFGTNWKAIPAYFSPLFNGLVDQQGAANITISCVDTIEARFEIAELLQQKAMENRYARDKLFYWIDCGNSRYTGQALLSTLSPINQPASKLFRPIATLPLITEEFKTLLRNQTDNDEPSCSTAEALNKQDLYINSTIADMGASLLFNLIREGMTPYRGFFHDIQHFRTQPIKVA